MLIRRALVLGAGGHAANAWEIGVIAGLADAGIDVRNADLFVGTSAGAQVAVQITSGGLSLDELYRDRWTPACKHKNRRRRSISSNGAPPSCARKREPSVPATS